MLATRLFSLPLQPDKGGVPSRGNDAEGIRWESFGG